MLRKAALTSLLSILMALGLAKQLHNYQDIQGLTTPVDGGWSPESDEIYGNIPVPSVASGKGKIRLLYRDWELATGYQYIPRQQASPDCVAQATAAGLDFRMAVQSIESVYRVPQFITSAPPIYGFSRVEIAGKPAFAPGGSRVRWAMEATQTYGILFAKNYLYAGYDLTVYDPSKSRQWGSMGVPDVLEDIAILTTVSNYYPVSTYEEVRDAIVAGYPVVVGSDVGFAPRTLFTFGNVKGERDKDGFIAANGRWAHAMCFIGVDDKAMRKGVCCLNSWGSNWVSGPTKLGQPAGSFWIDADTVTRMVSQQDAYAIKHIAAPLAYKVR